MQAESNSNKKQAENNKQKHDIFTDPALTKASSANLNKTEDPLAAYLKENWLHLLFSVFAVLAAFWIYDTLQNTRVDALRSAADSFVNARQEYLSATGSPMFGQAKFEKITPEQHDRLKARFKTLADTRPPYDVISELYMSLIANSPDLKKVEWKAISVNDRIRFLKELEAFHIARAYIDPNESADKELVSKGVAELFSLAKDGYYLQVPSLVSLSFVDLSEEQHQELLSQAEVLAAEYPESKNDLIAAGLVEAFGE